jgi:HlyD family secretion protein
MTYSAPRIAMGAPPVPPAPWPQASKDRKLPILAGGLIVILACGGCGNRSVPANNPDRDERIVVQTVTATRTPSQRTTTQPATVHAWYEARIFAKVSGYLTELNVDIGKVVKQDEVLGGIAVPEMVMREKIKEAMIKQLQAAERGKAKQLRVAEANVLAYDAKINEAKAEVIKAEANLTAARVERDRAIDLVNQRAVADRLLDEMKKKYDAANAEKAAAEAAEASAQADLEVGKAQVEAARADHQAAQAAIEMAQREKDELTELLKYARLKAPFEGVVTVRNVDKGDLVRDTPSGSGKNAAPLFVISQVHKVRVRVPVPERDAPLAGAGDKARITLQALPGEIFEGKVSRVAGAMDPQTRTMLVEIDLDNPEGKLLPGMFGQAIITLEPPRERIHLPAAAVRYDEKGKSYVYVVNSADEVSVVEVRTGLDDGEQIEITDGLTGGEKIVGPLLHRLESGDKVRVSED